MVLSREELISRITARIGDDTSDEALALLEDATDTLEEMSKGANPDGTDWKQKYEDNDKSWRERYKKRFMTGDKNLDPPDDGGEGGNKGDDNAPKTFEELFK